MVKHVKENIVETGNFFDLKVNRWDDVIKVAKDQLKQVREREAGLLQVIQAFTGFRDAGEPFLPQHMQSGDQSLETRRAS